jgi:hypothetical protein
MLVHMKPIHVFRSDKYLNQQCSGSSSSPGSSLWRRSTPVASVDVCPSAQEYFFLQPVPPLHPELSLNRFHLNKHSIYRMEAFMATVFLASQLCQIRTEVHLDLTWFHGKDFINKTMSAFQTVNKYCFGFGLDYQWLCKLKHSFFYPFNFHCNIYNWI